MEVAMRIRVSEKHGVNPALEQCYICGDDKGVVLFGRLPGDVEAPRQVVMDKDPCDKCRGLMKQGVILISVREEPAVKGGKQEEPYRTGKLVVVRDAFIERVINDPQVRDQILKARVTFVPDAAWDMLGLPK
jgi:hypothetical protein